MLTEKRNFYIKTREISYAYEIALIFIALAMNTSEGLGIFTRFEVGIPFYFSLPDS